ncbi:hypothetical protein CEUSTIGMA_g4081.t1 [Chlamydomonas eustigma]|uniref:DUF1990 domain-containing protein n=1 Tax=Chlamydomonas eustigma TaxID=1157962 RepID=A0A250X0Q9_9CHLO|nr:hypothetical protein CEUSTIGMA_g4081.t1 [Chlamydomonas eustigma]|eukprot:GAX76635.1 hypothetical protein CEUSTIGMA_g4081.t1 [Chlamydomonas eustigma]
MFPPIYLSLLKFDSKQQRLICDAGLEKGFNYNSSYQGLTKTNSKPPGFWDQGHIRVKVGKGRETFEAGKSLLKKWGQFQLGWAEVDSGTPVQVESPVCVVAKTLFFWTANPLKVMWKNQSLPVCSWVLAWSLISRGGALLT